MIIELISLLNVILFGTTYYDVIKTYFEKSIQLIKEIHLKIILSNSNKDEKSLNYMYQDQARNNDTIIKVNRIRRSKGKLMYSYFKTNPKTLLIC